MKKTIYSILAVTAGIILTSGCSKESLPVENNITGEATLSAELPVDLTKTAVDGTDRTKVIWSTGDTLSIWGGENNKFTISKGVGTKSGSFNGTVTTGTAQYALYPYNSSATISDGVITTNVRRTQVVPASSFDPKAAIMVGTISGTTITFRHAVAFLKITAPSDVTNLSEITIESNGGVQLTGDAKFSASTGAFTTTTGTKNKFVTVQPAGGTFTAGGIYYAAVIPGTYTGGLTVRYLYKDTIAHTLTENTKSNSTTLTLTTAGTAKLIGAAAAPFDHTYNAVQLWEGGPYWAKTNIGAAKETDAGLYFAWGYTTGQTPSGATFSNAFNTTNYPDLDMKSLDTEHDMAAANWGTWWKVPSYSNFNALKNSNNTSIQYVKDNTSALWSTYKVKGILVTGKNNGYTNNSIFLPAVGHGKDGSLKTDAEKRGSYWSSNDDTEYRTQAYYLGLCTDKSTQTTELTTNFKCYGFTVRPVH